MNFTIEIKKDIQKKKSRNKGKNTLDFPGKFVVIDIETTGLDPQFDEIIEIGAIKIENGNLIDTFRSLIKPRNEIDEYITKLTGITNNMLENAPSIKDIIGEFYNFIENNIILGHNVNFDINFLYDELLKVNRVELNNDFIDTMRIGRYLLKNLNHHRLVDLANNYNITVDNGHRALNDCMITLKVYNKMLEEVVEKYNDTEKFIRCFKKSKTKIDLKSIKTDKIEFDIGHPFYNKHCVFTGGLERMTRKEAMQIVFDLGGICSTSITKETNYLILGNNDYNHSVKYGKSNKQKKAEQLKLEGRDLEIISETNFYEIIELN